MGNMKLLDLKILVYNNKPCCLDYDSLTGETINTEFQAIDLGFQRRFKHIERRTPGTREDNLINNLFKGRKVTLL